MLMKLVWTGSVVTKRRNDLQPPKTVYHLYFKVMVRTRVEPWIELWSGTILGHDGSLFFFLRLLTFVPFSDLFSDFSFYETFSSRSLIYPCILCHSRSSSYAFFPWRKNITDQKMTKIDATDPISTQAQCSDVEHTWPTVSFQDLPGLLPICVRHAIH